MVTHMLKLESERIKDLEIVVYIIIFVPLLHKKFLFFFSLCTTLRKQYLFVSFFSLSFLPSLYFLLFIYLFPSPLIKYIKMYNDQPVERSNNKFIRWFGFDQFEPERAVSSYWVSSKTFFVIRLILALYSFIVLWVNIGVSAHEGRGQNIFAFFTNLTFVGLHAYLIVSKKKKKFFLIY